MNLSPNNRNVSNVSRPFLFHKIWPCFCCVLPYRYGVNVPFGNDLRKNVLCRVWFMHYRLWCQLLVRIFMFLAQTTVFANRPTFLPQNEEVAPEKSERTRLIRGRILCRISQKNGRKGAEFFKVCFHSKSWNNLQTYLNFFPITLCQRIFA
jgi:hypothetical protein